MAADGVADAELVLPGFAVSGAADADGVADPAITSVGIGPSTS